MCTIAERLVVRLPAAAQGDTRVFADHVAAGTFNADVATDVERAVGPDIDGCCLQLPFLRPAVEASKWSAPLGQVMIVSAIWSAVAASIETQGRAAGLKTWGKPRMQLALWMHNFGSQYTTIRSFRYSRSTPGCLRPSFSFTASIVR